MMRPPHDRRQGERQGHAAHRPPGSGAQDVRGVLHLRRHEFERRRGEDEDVGEGVERDDQRQAGEAVDVERPRLGAGQENIEPVQPSGVRSREQDPGDRAGVGRRDERRQHQHACQPSRRHVGTRHRPGERHGEDAGETGRRGAKRQGIQQGIDIARPAVGGEVVGEGELTGPFGGKAGDHQIDERAHHQEQQHGDDRDPQQPGGIEGEPARPGRRRIDDRKGNGHFGAPPHRGNRDGEVSAQRTERS